MFTCAVHAANSPPNRTARGADTAITKYASELISSKSANERGRVVEKNNGNHHKAVGALQSMDVPEYWQLQAVRVLSAVWPFSPLILR